MIQHHHTTDALDTEPWAAATCPTCEARALRTTLDNLAADLDDSGLLVDAVDTAGRVRAALMALDYVLALVDANNLNTDTPL